MLQTSLSAKLWYGAASLDFIKHNHRFRVSTFLGEGRGLDDLFTELKRRNVFKVGVAYLALGWVVIQVTSIAVPALNLPESLNSIVFYLGIVGFPFALFFAWAFELTPDGIKRSHEVEGEHSISHHTGRKLDFVIIAFLVLALGGVVYDSYLSPSQSKAGANLPTTAEAEANISPSIAVLAFEDFSPDKDQEYFADGISDEILNLLAKTNAMKVTGRTSSFSFKGTKDDIPTIAGKLNVNHILEGSINKSGNRLKITAQLIRDDGYHIWSETYKRDLTDIFEIQEEIAAAILRELKAKLLGESYTPKAISTTNMEAFDLYLKGKQLYNDNSFEALAMARDYMERALKLDLDFTLAEVSLINIVMSQLSTGSIDEEPALSNITKRAEDLLAERPNSMDAIIAMARIKDYQEDNVSNLQMMEKARALGANSASFYTGYGNALRRNNRGEEAIATLRHAILLDPMDGVNYWFLSNQLANSGAEDEAIEILKKGVEVAPRYPEIVSSLAYAMSNAKGDLLTAIEYRKQAADISPSDPEFFDSLAHDYMSLESFDQAEKLINKSLKMAPKRGQANDIKSWLMFILGEKEPAVSLIEKTLEAADTVHRHNSKNLLIESAVTFMINKRDYVDAEKFLLSYVPELKQLAAAPTIKNEAALLKAIPFPPHLLSLISLYQLQGKQADAKNLLRHTTFYTPDYILKTQERLTGENYYRLAGRQALSGEKEKALDHLITAFDHGYMGFWHFDYLYNSALYSLHEEPRYKALIKRIRTEIARQRELLPEEDAT